MLECYKSPVLGDAAIELIQAGGDLLSSEIDKLLILFGIKRNFQTSAQY